MNSDKRIISLKDLSENEINRLWSIEEAAAYLGVTKTTIRRKTNNGLIKAVIINSAGHRRFRKEDLDEYLGGIQNG